MKPFKFQFSLEILNHLGRGLYRNFATVIAEAVSNSWDAEATRVDIEIDEKSKTMTIKDNGKGMNEEDFQGKFLNVGYTRRDEEKTSRRKVLGRKGIGKLAMLSVSDKISIHSKKQEFPEIGGTINNGDLDENIKDKKEYTLAPLGDERVFGDRETGTYLKFESIKPSMNRPEILRKYLAVIFNFSFSFVNEEFDIYLNGHKISENDLVELYDGTKFLWTMDLSDNMRARFNQLEHEEDLGKQEFLHEGKIYEIKGYVASVDKVSKLKVRGSSDQSVQGDGNDFKAGVHLFVNGRLRQENILDDLRSDRLVVRYLYGEIHVDGFDENDDSNDIFTSSREGIIRDEPVYLAFLVQLKKIQQKVINDWSKWRKGQSKKPLEAVFDNLNPEKKAVIEELLNRNDDEMRGSVVSKGIRKMIPEQSGKKILICHSSKDKNLAHKVEQELLNRGIPPDQILYTNSDNIESRVPVNVPDIYDYIRDFFVQEWFPNPYVVFVVSPDMEKSWGASLEAGAAWVTRRKHKHNHNHRITVKENHRPQPPLDQGRLFLEFDSNGEFKDAIDAKRLFDEIKSKLDEINVTPPVL